MIGYEFLSGSSKGSIIRLGDIFSENFPDSRYLNQETQSIALSRHLEVQNKIEKFNYLEYLIFIKKNTQLDEEQLSTIFHTIFQIPDAKNSQDADELFNQAFKMVSEAPENEANISKMELLLFEVYHLVKSSF